MTAHREAVRRPRTEPGVQADSSVAPCPALWRRRGSVVLNESSEVLSTECTAPLARSSESGQIRSLPSQRQAGRTLAEAYRMAPRSRSCLRATYPGRCSRCPLAEPCGFSARGRRPGRCAGRRSLTGRLTDGRVRTAAACEFAHGGPSELPDVAQGNARRATAEVMRHRYRRSRGGAANGACRRRHRRRSSP
jgi:hypothetical protein